MPNSLVGCWSLRAWQRTSEDGSASYPLGEHPSGLLVYTADGLMAGGQIGGNYQIGEFVIGAEGDFTFEDVTRPAFDLSDRGVEGRALPGPVDAYLYTERGVSDQDGMRAR